jgi:hypothetical protein
MVCGYDIYQNARQGKTFGAFVASYQMGPLVLGNFQFKFFSVIFLKVDAELSKEVASSLSHGFSKILILQEGC